MTNTIYPAKHYPIYKVWQVIGGWKVVYLSDRHNYRDIDGGKIHKSRQNAAAKAYRLNAARQPVQYWTRPVDAGNGRQNVTVADGVITAQQLVARQGYYTGDGNPELVGRPVAALRGMGFRRVKGPQAFNSFTGKWTSLDESIYPEEEIDE